MDIYPFERLYIADLNAIQELENTGIPHEHIVEAIQKAFPSLSIWIDAGINDKVKLNQWEHLNTRMVLGTESFTSTQQYTALTANLKKPPVLSLDFLPQGYAGPSSLLNTPSHWPLDVIIMSLAKVGANNGIDSQTMREITAKSKQHHYYIAGGVRHLDDLMALKPLAIKGALIASALHHKQLTTADLETLAKN